MRKFGALARVSVLVIAALLVWRVGAAMRPQAGTAAVRRSHFRILLTNDDGIQAVGLEALARVLPPVGEVTVVAPADNQSGVGNSIRVGDPIYVDAGKFSDVVSGFAVTGPPATCVEVALKSLLKEPPDLVVSGINRGDNLGLVTYYSGTVGAAREATLQGVPSVAVSLVASGHPHYEAAAAFTAKLVAAIKEQPLPKGVFLNVNVPAGAEAAMKGVQITRQSMLTGEVSFAERKSPGGRRYFWNVYRPPTQDEEGTDVWAVAHGHIAITPLHLGEYDAAAVKTLSTWKLRP